jgi:hypothetical protein
MTTFLLHAIATGILGTQLLPAPTRSPDSCALLTQAEAEAILGGPIEPPTAGGSGECHYATKDGSDEILVYVMPLGFESKEEFHAFLVKDTKATNERIKKNLQGTGATVKETTVDPVPGIGDAAYFADPSLVVLKGGRVLNIIAADRKQAEAVAGKAVARF